MSRKDGLCDSCGNRIKKTQITLEGYDKSEDGSYETYHKGCEPIWPCNKCIGV